MSKYRLGLPPSCYYEKKAADALRQPLSFISREMIADVFDSQVRGRQDLTVCFTGHRIIPSNAVSALSARLDALLEGLYRRGYRDFINGGARGFDVLAAERVIALKGKHPDVRLLLAIPCYEQWQRWAARDCERYERIFYHADSTQVLSRQYYDGCMQARNRYMVDHASFCLCYLTHSRGGTMSTVAYAMQQDCPVLNLAMPDACEAFLREE